MYALNRLAVWRSCELCAPVGDKQPAWPHHFTSWVEMITYVVMCVCIHYDSECVTADIIIWVGGGVIWESMPGCTPLLVHPQGLPINA